MQVTMIFSVMILAIASTPISSTARAECPASLSTDETIRCITVEGAGYNYQEYTAERAAEMREQKVERASGKNRLTSYGERLYVVD